MINMRKGAHYTTDWTWRLALRDRVMIWGHVENLCCLPVSIFVHKSMHSASYQIMSPFELPVDWEMPIDVMYGPQTRRAWEPKLAYTSVLTSHQTRRWRLHDTRNDGGDGRISCFCNFNWQIESRYRYFAKSYSIPGVRETNSPNRLIVHRFDRVVLTVISRRYNAAAIRL